MHTNGTAPEARFAGFRYIEARRCLERDDGTEVALRPKSLETFRHLAAHADRVVAREALHRAIWGRTVVTDDSLCKCIAEIRHAIGDAPHEVLRTVPRHGYMLVADRSAADTEAATVPSAMAVPSAASVASSASVAGGGQWSWRVLATALAVALVFALAHLAMREPTAFVAAPSASDDPSKRGERLPTVSLRIAAPDDPAERASLDALVGTVRTALGRERGVSHADADYRLAVALRGSDTVGERCLALELTDARGAIVFADAYPIDDARDAARAIGAPAAGSDTFWRDIFARAVECAPDGEAVTAGASAVDRAEPRRERQRRSVQIDDAVAAPRRR